MHHVKHPHLPMPQIINIMRLFIPLKYSEEFHADADNELIHIINGSVKLCFESGEVYTAGKNETLFIPRGVRHKDIFDVKNGVEVFHLSFQWQDDSRFFSAASPDCLYSLPSKEKTELLLLFDMMRLDMYNSPESLIIADARLAHLLAIAWKNVFPDTKNAAARESDNYARMVNFAHNYMTAHLSEHIDINSVASYLHTSRATLLRAFHHASGMSFNSYLRSIRMQEAFYLLRERALNVAECAVRCGYSDPAYFSRTFKNHFGFSPKKVN
jgi:AraC-like DNA-binding protein